MIFNSLRSVWVILLKQQSAVQIKKSAHKKYHLQSCLLIDYEIFFCWEKTFLGGNGFQPRLGYSCSLEMWENSPHIVSQHFFQPFAYLHRGHFDVFIIIISAEKQKIFVKTFFYFPFNIPAAVCFVCIVLPPPFIYFTFHTYFPATITLISKEWSSSSKEHVAIKQ